MKTIILDDDMAAQHGIVGQRDVVADLAIVADMRADHEHAFVADRGEAAIVLGAGIHGDAVRGSRSPCRSSSCVGPPRYFTDCGGVPSEANG